jgi:hypothetical protein
MSTSTRPEAGSGHRGAGGAESGAAATSNFGFATASAGRGGDSWPTDSGTGFAVHETSTHDAAIA